MNAVVVSGRQPGPGLWKVVSNDGHALWVLGTVEPLPRELQWQSTEVEAVIAQADEVLSAPGIAVYWDLGFFSSLALLPSALRVRRNPDGKKLEDVLPADLLARWLAQKERYLGWELSVDRWRPMFAAHKLHEAALKEHGLGEDVVGPRVRQLVEAAGLKPTAVTVRADVDEPRRLIREYNRTGVNDEACMEGTLRRLEAGIPRLVARANAWATGDIETLHRLPGQGMDRGCINSVLNSDFAQWYGYGDIDRKVRSLWLEQAQRALASNEVSLALLPMDEVLSTDGMLAELVGHGYQLVPPSDGGTMSAQAP
ncbi:MAG: TraB/GumN family protein [Lysobacter sp.]